MLFKKILVVLSFFFGATSSVHAETPVYGVLAGAPDTPYWRAMELGLREGASEAMAEYYAQPVDLAQANSVAETCNSMLDRKPNILLVALPDTTMLAACFEKSQNLNIPVINIGNAAIHQEDKNVSSVITTDHNETATITANYLLSVLDNSTEGAVVIPVTDNNKLVVEGLKEKLLENAPSLKVITAAHEELINVAPDIRAIISTDNASILNAVSDQLPEDGNLLILSVDGLADNAALLETGIIHASITPLPYLLGKSAMQQASKAINTDGGNEAVYIKPVLLTRQILEDGNDPVLDYIK